MSAPAGVSRLHEIVDHWAAEKPDASALTFGDFHLTWTDFRRRTRQLAAALADLGAGVGDRIASYDKNHPFCLELTMAGSRIGAVNTVVNFRLAPDEVAYVLNDAEAKVLLIGHEFAGVWKRIADRVPTVQKVIVVGGDGDEYESFLASAPDFAGETDGSAESAALQLYTSGTTGFPKGAVLSHRGLLAHTRAVCEILGVNDDRVNLLAMPLFHVGGSSYALTGFYPGIPTVMVREPHPAYLLPAIMEHGANQTFFVPALIGMLLGAGEAAVRALGKLQRLAYGASPMPLPLLERCLATLPESVNFLQVYGLTEVSGVATYLPDADHRDPAVRHRLLSAGVPLPGVEVRIQDLGTDTPAEAGASGEVWLRTEQVMSEYWHRPEASAETIDADGWLHTGDIGYVDADGYLFIHDRLKDMIISGGENIYSSEVENAVAAHPSVADASVIGVPDEKWGETVRAVVVAVPGQSIDEAEIIAFCRERLAHYKCPRSVVVAEELPRNPSGKVLKTELRKTFGS
ncbi:long-chain-fatty-acid--CoA ligase [Fodinicola acaciae]|uniref:long-chain-fatty-acid--CoA ligase n=1 Tax=Fodinicola acaciae TaxID=2681555 RepID=UPI0013D702A6|nr:long-chain-fatty-acid--CoA ligase [Fodinicola acaciae]